MNRCGLVFFCSEFRFGRCGERELESFKVEFKENVVFSKCLSKLIFGTRGDFNLNLGTCFVELSILGGSFQISVLGVCRSANRSISSAHMPQQCYFNMVL